MDADRAAARSPAPLLIIASDSDRYLNARDARALYAESAAADKHIRLPSGAAHGVEILESADGAEVWDQIVAFLRAHTHRPG